MQPTTRRAFTIPPDRLTAAHRLLLGILLTILLAATVIGGHAFRDHRGTGARTRNYITALGLDVPALLPAGSPGRWPGHQPPFIDPRPGPALPRYLPGPRYLIVNHPSTGAGY